MKVRWKKRHTKIGAAVNDPIIFDRVREDGAVLATVKRNAGHWTADIPAPSGTGRLGQFMSAALAKAACQRHLAGGHNGR